MPVKILSWNINRIESSVIIPQLEKFLSDIDILLLIESDVPDDDIDKIGFSKISYKIPFNEGILTPKFYIKKGLAGTIEHFSTHPSKRLIFIKLAVDTYGEILIGGIHFPGKLDYDGGTQWTIANNYSNFIKGIESNDKHSIIVGDFNMNPFESGMIAANGFNATSSSDVAKNIWRTLHYEKYKYFYSPMWNWMGEISHCDGNKKVPGSYYFQTANGNDELHWNLFDKFIIRPEIMEIVDYSSIKHLDFTTLENFITKNDNFSDHYPLVFKLNITLK